MLSEKILSEILGIEIQDMTVVSETVSYVKLGDYDAWEHIDIYNLTNKAKEWAKDKNYNLFSGIRIKSDAICEVFYRWSETDEQWDFTAATEYDAIFKACDFIIKRMDLDNEN
jgi:hypothetical protein